MTTCDVENVARLKNDDDADKKYKQVFPRKLKGKWILGRHSGMNRPKNMGRY